MVIKATFSEMNTNIQKMSKIRPCPRAGIDGKRLFLSISMSFADNGNTRIITIIYTA